MFKKAKREDVRGGKSQKKVNNVKRNYGMKFGTNLIVRSMDEEFATILIFVQKH